jgi:hypothetical protein
MSAKAIDLANKAKSATAELAALIEQTPIESQPKPKASTKATDKYQAKVGLAARTYKLKAETADSFKAACEASGESQAAVLSRLMTAFVAGADERPRCFFCRWFGRKSAPG